MRDIITKLEELNVEQEQLNEGLADMAHEAEKDHEVQMARSDCYKSAKYAVAIHKMLKDVSEMEGIDGWVAAKITKAADYLGSVKHYMEGQAMSDVELAVVPVAGDMTDAMTLPQESIEEAAVTENAERIIKVTNIDFAGPSPDKMQLPTSVTLRLNVPYDADEDDIYDMVADDLEDRYGVKVSGFETQFGESVEEDEDIIGDIIASLSKTKERMPMPKSKPAIPMQSKQKIANKMALPKPRPDMSMAQDTTVSLDKDFSMRTAKANQKAMQTNSKFSEWSKK